jgi:hypothetical protein
MNLSLIASKEAVIHPAQAEAFKIDTLVVPGVRGLDRSQAKEHVHSMDKHTRRALVGRTAV